MTGQGVASFSFTITSTHFCTEPDVSAGSADVPSAGMALLMSGLAKYQSGTSPKQRHNAKTLAVKSISQIFASRLILTPPNFAKINTSLSVLGGSIWFTSFKVQRYPISYMGFTHPKVRLSGIGSINTKGSDNFPTRWEGLHILYMYILGFHHH